MFCGSEKSRLFPTDSDVKWGRADTIGCHLPLRVEIAQSSSGLSVGEDSIVSHPEAFVDPCAISFVSRTMR